MARGRTKSKTTKTRSAARRSAFRTVRRDRFGRFNKRGRTVTRVRVPFKLKREKDTRRPPAPGRTRVPAPPAPAIIRTRKELIAALERAKTKQEKIAIRQRFSSPKRKGRGRR